MENETSAGTEEAPVPVVLVVDDDPLARGMVAEMLAGMGFEVRQAESAVAAVASISQHGVVDLLLLDLKMPEMSGVELHQLLIKDLPHLKVVYMTGFPVEAAQVESPVLKKPFTFAELADAVTAALPQIALLSPGSK
jgi:CheY-like chemotaxis protein